MLRRRQNRRRPRAPAAPYGRGQPVGPSCWRRTGRRERPADRWGRRADRVLHRL